MLLAEGVSVWGTARSRERLAPFSESTHFRPVLLDLANQAQIEDVCSTASLQAGGAFDVVINNACYGVFGAFDAMPFDVWQAQIAAVLVGTLQISHHMVGAMKARNRGCLVHVSSVAVEYPLPFMAGYNVAKAGLSALSESLMFETRGSNVTVIDFRPADYRTDFNQAMHVMSPAVEPKDDSRLTRVWNRLEANLAAAPAPQAAASDLRRALVRGKSCTIYSGGIFQAKLAPLFSRLSPAGLRRWAAARYFGVV